jgi:hypothetical protein
VSTIPSGPVDRGEVFIVTRPLEFFLRTEVRSSVLLLAVAVAALVWTNSPWVASYEALWTTNLSVWVGEHGLAKDLRHWVNDGLMTLFFLVVGLEVTRELKRYKRRDWSAAVVPALAALGAMVVSALLYLVVNTSRPAARGWPIVVATDLAFVLRLLPWPGGDARRSCASLSWWWGLSATSSLPWSRCCMQNTRRLPGPVPRPAMAAIRRSARGRDPRARRAQSSEWAQSASSPTPASISIGMNSPSTAFCA